MGNQATQESCFVSDTMMLRQLAECGFYITFSVVRDMKILHVFGASPALFAREACAPLTGRI